MRHWASSARARLTFFPWTKAELQLLRAPVACRGHVLPQIHGRVQIPLIPGLVVSVTAVRLRPARDRPRPPWVKLFRGQLFKGPARELRPHTPAPGQIDSHDPFSPHVQAMREPHQCWTHQSQGHVRHDTQVLRGGQQVMYNADQGDHGHIPMVKQAQRSQNGAPERRLQVWSPQNTTACRQAKRVIQPVQHSHKRSNPRWVSWKGMPELQLRHGQGQR